jgi:hypothetical protein
MTIGLSSTPSHRFPTTSERSCSASIDYSESAEHRRAEEPDWEPPEDYFHQSKDQIRALLFIADFYPANPLPPR